MDSMGRQHGSLTISNLYSSKYLEFKNTNERSLYVPTSNDKHKASIYTPVPFRSIPASPP